MRCTRKKQIRKYNGLEVYCPLWNLHERFTLQESKELQREDSLNKVKPNNYQEPDNEFNTNNDIDSEVDKSGLSEDE